MCKWVLFSLMLFVLFFVPCCAAVDLQQVISDARPNSVIELNESMLSISNIVIDKPLTFKSNNGIVLAPVDNIYARFVIRANVKFENIMFYGFTEAIKCVNGVNSEFINCRFENCRNAVSSDGNGIFSFNNCVFKDNCDSVIKLLGGCVVNITNGSSFEGNSATGSIQTYSFGSCINTFDSNVSISDTSFESNNADCGGCISFNNCNQNTFLSVSDSQIISNSANEYGGFLFSDGVKNYSVSVHGSNFRDNKVNVNGVTSLSGCGGVFLSTSRSRNCGYVFQLSSNSFYDNIANNTGSIACACDYSRSKYSIDRSNSFNNRNDAMINGFKNRNSDNVFEWL